MIGEVLGKYRLDKELGRGGMGAVYLATHEAIGKRVAIKVLHPDKADAELSRRFFNEARAAAQVEHPGMVEVFGFATGAGGQAYLVMEYLEGQSLAQRLGEGALDEATSVELMRQAASAIAAAHRAGIVHRDLKPHNLFLTVDEAVAGGVRLKVLDFGIAKLRPSVTDPVATATGEVFGTPRYMSPEQCRGAGEVTARSDVYSLGVVLYQMVCGQPPFLARGLGEVISDHLRTVPAPPRAQGAVISPALEALIMRMLAKSADDRPSAAELVAALDGLRGAAPSAQPVDALGSTAAPEAGLAVTGAPAAAHRTATAAAAVAPTEASGSLGTGAVAVTTGSPTRAGAAGTVPADAPTTTGRGRLILGGAIAVAVAAAVVAYAVARGGAGDPEPALDLASAERPALEAACQRKHAAACTELGRRVLVGADAGAARRYDLAFPHYLAGCDLGDAAGCTAAAELYEAGNGVAADPRRAVAAFSRGCELGDAAGCAQLGNAQRVGAGTALDPTAAVRSLTRGCELGSPMACRDLGTLTELGTGISKSPAQAARWFARALELGKAGCDAGDAESCNSLGVQYFYGHGVDQDQARGFAMTRRGCDLGSIDACANASQSYILGLGAERDPPRGLAMAEASCAAGSRAGCEVVSIVVGNGYAGEADPARARALVERECKISPRYCRALASELVVGNILPRDPARALEVARPACAAGNPMACDLAAGQLRVIHRDDADQAEIDRLRQRGCDAGDAGSCMSLARDLRRRDRAAEAAARFDHACQLSRGLTGCSSLGELYLAGEGVKVDRERGLALMTRACEGKDPGACGHLGRLYRRGQWLEPNKPRALELLLAGCDNLDDKSCLEAAEMLATGDGVTADPGRAAELRKVACARLPTACK